MTANETLSIDKAMELRRLVKSSDSIELKLTIPEQTYRSAFAALGVDPLEAQIRQVFFFDTPDLDLNKAGVVARARRVQGRGDDSVVKLRPVVPADMPAKLRRLPEFVVEVDALPGGYVCSASLKGVPRASVRETVIGGGPYRKLFSKEQRAFFAEHAPPGLAIDELDVLGPIFVLKVKLSPKAFSRRLVGEMWMYPDGSRLVELSAKCLPGEGLDLAQEMIDFLASKGISTHGEQQTKTKTALEFFSAELHTELIQAEFEKNIPFALAVGKSAKDPDDPVSVVGIDTPNFVVDSFDVSYGDPQTVAVTAKRDLALLLMNYRINGGRTRRQFAREWDGGERYGFENVDYYAEYRGQIRGASAGDDVQVWFSGLSTDWDEFGWVESERFTYTVASDTESPVLIVANEDYTGFNPTEEPPGGPPKYVDEHVAALQANGVTPDVWDVDAQGVPHDLGILSHYAAVVWYYGDNRLTQDREDVLTELLGQGPFEDGSVAERQQYLTVAVRDYLNEGGKLVLAGETVGYYGFIGALLGGIYYGLDGAPDEECVIPAGGDLFSDCLLLADDFTQYYLGAFSRVSLTASGVKDLEGGPFGGEGTPFGGPATVDNPTDEVGAFTVTSDVLPVDEFPQFASAPAAEYVSPEGPFFAVEGDWAVGSLHADDSYMRLGRTFDLTGIAATDEPTFEMQISYDTEEGYDHVIVEARTAGQEDWTTLPDLNDGTTSDMPAECEVGFLVEEHPNLAKYLTVDDPCTTPGSATPGLWNSFTESSDGWVTAAFDLSAYADQQVEIIVSYVTDFAVGGVGVIIDDTRLTTTGGVVDAEGFETGLGAWSVLGTPDGSPGNLVDFERTAGLGGITAAVTTPDSVLFGFGLEQLESLEARNAVVGAVLGYLAGP